MLRLLSFAAIIALALSQDCGGQWQRFGNTCYLVRSDRQFWGEARKQCQAESADLPIVKTAEVRDFLTGLLSNTRGHAWIGLSDDVTEGTWMWVDNSPLTSPNFWRNGQPDNGAGDPGTQNENCVEMDPTSDGKWNDENCIAPQYYICARDINQPVLCDESNGWREYSGKCYLWQDSRRTFVDAESFCNLIGGNIASVTSQAEQNFLMSQQSTIDIQYWIGLTDMGQGHEGDYVWTDGSSWGDGEYSNWDVDQPDNRWYNLNGDCAAVDHPEIGVWQIDHCSDSKRSFCERVEGTCASGWKYFNGQCYQVNGNNLKTWTDAKHYCEAQGAYMVTIMSDPENQFVASQMIDFRDAGFQNMYIGISDTSIDGNFQWVSGSSLTYTNWNDGMPADKVGQDDCGSIYTGALQAKWDVMNCYNLQPFMCKIQVGRPVQDIPPDQEIGSCPRDWQLFGDYCYYFSLEDTTTWNGAQTTCEGMNANLASVMDENEQSFLSTRADGIRRNMWIGLHDLSGEGRFEWSDYSSLIFLNWAPGEPNNVGNGDTGEDCVHLTSAYHNVGMWNDLECDTQENYICKRHKDDDGVIRTPTPFPTGISNDKCGSGWEYDGNSNVYNGRCYSFRPSDYKTWEGATLQCKLEGADLTSISDFNEQTFINKRFGDATETSIWFGASDFSAEGGWEWNDGSPFRYLNWNAGEPNNYGDEGEHCVEMYLITGKWNDNLCTRNYGYVCKQSAILQKNFYPYRYTKLEDPANYKTILQNIYPEDCAAECLAMTDYECRSFDYDRVLMQCMLSDVDMSVGTVPTDDAYPIDHYETDFSAPLDPPKTTVDPAFGCPDGTYSAYGDSCYLLNTAMNEFASARTLCTMQSTDLVSIRDMNENNFVMSLVYSQTSETRVWIGMSDLDQEMYYTWTDGTDVTYTSWAYYEPNNSGVEDCVEMWLDKGYWNDIPCTGYNFQSVCKTPRMSGGIMPMDDGCDEGWNGYMSSCYWFNTQGKSWSSAQSDCASQGGHLAVINHKYENAYFSSQLGLETTMQRYWIGLSDSEEPGFYKWVDNSPILITNWDEGQPDDSLGKCVGASSGIPKSGFWADMDCSMAMPYVCETQRDGWTTKRPDNPAPTNPTNIGCSVGWIGYGSYCFKIYEEDQRSNRLSWDNAISFCRDQGGDLASFHSSTEEMYIRDSYLPDVPDNEYGYWIGLNDRSVEGGFSWVDGTPLEYTNWDGGEPNDSGGEDCVELFLNPGRGWNDQRCNDQRHWICRIEKNKTPITPAPEPPATKCPTDSNWFYSSPYCYYVTDANLNWRRSWSDADAWCKAGGGNLASIHSDEEQAFINVLVKRAVSSYWIGLREYTVEGDYSWTDGSALDYVNWNPNEPNDHAGEEQCGELETFDEGRWNDNACGIKNAFICKRDEDNTNPITSAPTEPPTGNCPVGWYKLLTKCYRIYGTFENDRVNWLDAKAYCQSFPGANLATIHNKQQQAALSVMMKATQGYDVWIGLSDSGSSGKFHWTDGSNLDYTNWGSGQPDGVLFPGEGSGSCIEMMNDADHPGDWNDVECENMNAYLCQQPLDPSLPDNSPDIGICEKSDYIDYFNSCYKMFTEPMSYDGAMATCEADGTTLATVKDGWDEAFIETMMYIDDIRNAWIGLQDLDKDGKYTWLDGWPLFFTKWGRNEPSEGDGEGCVRVTQDTLWQDAPCDNSHAFICKLSFDEPPMTPAPPEGYCPEGWKTFGTNCYFFESDVTRASWPESVYDCQLKYGAKLVSIHSKAENEFIAKNARTAIGIQSLWLGLNRNDDGGFQWDDDTPVDYVNWANDEPNGDMSGQNCVDMYDDSFGKWKDDDCYGTAGYVCQLKQLSSPPGTQTTPGKQTGSPSTHTPDMPQEQTGVSAGAIIGIVIAITIVVLAISLLGFFLFQRHRQSTLSSPGSINSDPSIKSPTGFDNALYAGASTDSSGKVNISSDA